MADSSPITKTVRINNMKAKSITGSPKDPPFLWASRVLAEHGVGVSRKTMLKAYQMACNHIHHARRHFVDFLETLDLKDYDLLAAGECFLGLLLQKAGITPADAFPTTRARMHLASRLRQRTRVAMGHFFNTILLYLKVVGLHTVLK